MERPKRGSGESTKRADKRRRYADCRNDERAYGMPNTVCSGDADST